MGFFDIFRRNKSKLLKKLDQDQELIEAKLKPNSEIEQPNEPNQKAVSPLVVDMLSNIDNKLDQVLEILKVNRDQPQLAQVQNSMGTKFPAYDKLLSNITYLNSRLDRLLTRMPNAPNEFRTVEVTEKDQTEAAEEGSEQLSEHENEHEEGEHLTLRLKEVIEVMKDLQSVTPTELAEQLHIKRPSAYELLQKLVSMNMAVDVEGKYSLKPQEPKQHTVNPLKNPN